MVGVFTQCRCFTYINIFNPSALHILPYLILYAPLWGTIPIFKMWKLYSFQYQCRFLWQLVFNRAFIGVIDQHGFILSAQQGPEWLLTHYRILRRYVINYVPISIECHQFQTAAGMVSIIFERESLFYYFLKSKYRIICLETNKGPWGPRPWKVTPLDLQILIMLCVLSSEPHSILLRKRGHGEDAWVLTVQTEAKGWSVWPRKVGDRLTGEEVAW